MTTALTLPAVASRYYTDCKKCNCQRYHIVVAHTTSTSAKLECEVCHSKKTLKTEAAKKAQVKATRAKAAARSMVSMNRWSEVRNLINEGQSQSYNMKLVFKLNSTIKHPKFGLGLVTSVADQSMEVMFEDGPRSLVHGRA